MNCNFILSSMGHLRYFIPLTNYLNGIGYRSRYFYSSKEKYDSPTNRLGLLRGISEKESFELHEIGKLNKCPSDFTFLVEGGNRDRILYKTRKISFTCQTDFQIHYPKYVNDMNDVIFPSKYFAEYYGMVNKKNMYLGSPKYDIKFDRAEILEKYKLKGDKFALVLFPRVRDLGKVDLKSIYKILNDDGYTVILKTRGKEPADEGVRPSYYFEDEDWYPHPTMEFIEISDIVVNFGSTAIKECVLLKTPLVDFDIKPFKTPMDFLYKYDYCKNLGKTLESRSFSKAIDELSSMELDSEFKKAMDAHLFSPGNVSAAIEKECLK